MSDVPALMDLQEFVQSTIVEVMTGVRRAADALHNDNLGNIKPTKGSSGGWQEIKFDIAVTVTGKGSGEGGARVKVLGLIDVGGAGAIAHEEETVSRIQFSVPVAFQY